MWTTNRWKRTRRTSEAEPHEFAGRGGVRCPGGGGGSRGVAGRPDRIWSWAGHGAGPEFGPARGVGIRGGREFQTGGRRHPLSQRPEDQVYPQLYLGRRRQIPLLPGEYW